MSFGFKFFAGWLLGMAGFSLDLFVAAIFSGFEFSSLIFFTSSMTQIFGFSFMIYIFERKVLYPKVKNFVPFVKKQITNFKSWAKFEKIGLIAFTIMLIIQVSGSMLLITKTSISTNDWNLRAQAIYSENKIPLDPLASNYLGGEGIHYPLNDALLKVWVANVLGEFDQRSINLVSIFYYLGLLAFFYFLLPSKINKGIKLFATYILSTLPLLYFNSYIVYTDLLFSIFLLMAVGSMYLFIKGQGNSFYYLAGMGLAFSIWTKIEGFTILFPIMIATTWFLLLSKKVSLKDFSLQWFFAILTVVPWVFFQVTKNLNFLGGDFSTFSFVLSQKIVEDVLSSILLLGHYNLLWIIILAVIVFRFKDIRADQSLQYLGISLVSLFVIYNGIIFFTDKELSLNALTQINMQLTPIAVLFLAVFFDKINTRAPLENIEASKHTR